MTHEWTTSRLEELSINFDGRRRPVKESARRPGPYLYYGVSGVVDHVDAFLFDGEYLLVAEDGENLRTRLSLLPQPALPQVTDPRQGALARRAPRGAAAGAVLPPRVHPAARVERARRARAGSRRLRSGVHRRLLAARRRHRHRALHALRLGHAPAPRHARAAHPSAAVTSAAFAPPSPITTEPRKHAQRPCSPQAHALTPVHPSAIVRASPFAYRHAARLAHACHTALMLWPRKLPSWPVRAPADFSFC